MQKNNSLRSLVLTAILLALGMVLPFLTGQLPAIGQAISPLHIPAFIAGLTCGWGWGAALGFILPLLRSVTIGMPKIVAAVPMAFELAAYGAMCGLLYPRFRRLIARKSHLPAMLAALVLAMLAGRIVGGAAKAIMLGFSGAFTFDMFIAAYFVGTAPGALIHLIVVPAVVLALEKARLSPLG